MAKILVTGSSGGLGLMTGRLLAEEGHRVVLHARSEARAEAVRAALPQAEAVVVGDLSTLAAMRDVADQANGQGRFDAVIHNVAIGACRKICVWVTTRDKDGSDQKGS
jgi:NAD(P)-dependent dehydrogenase (short-subunit alcohol dehydrogenase family)